MSKKPEEPTKEEVVKTCFVIMPIAATDGYEAEHWNKVYEDIFKVAITNAGFVPERADEVRQTNLIHLDILSKLLDSHMAICDLSSRNPNVLFELGLRQAFDKPTVLVQERGTKAIFDIAPLRYTEYNRELSYRDVLNAQTEISRAISATDDAYSKNSGVNSIIHLLKLGKAANLGDVKDASTMDVLWMLQNQVSDIQKALNVDPVEQTTSSKNAQIKLENLMWDLKVKSLEQELAAKNHDESAKQKTNLELLLSYNEIGKLSHTLSGESLVFYESVGARLKKLLQPKYSRTKDEKSGY